MSRWQQQTLPFDGYPVGLTVTDEERAVLREVEARRGRMHAITVGDLAARTGIDPRRVQQVVKHLVERHQVPIGTATTRPFGYFIIEDDQERRAVRDHLVRRALSILVRARAYCKSGWVSGLIGQIEMKFEDNEDVGS